MTTIRLNEISDNPGARKSRMRVGRGIGSGKGKTCGRGIKGQKSREGVSLNGFEGGQMPLYRRLPKRGFHHHARQEFLVLNLDDLQRMVESGKLSGKETVTSALLKEKRLIRERDMPVKLLGRGELKTKLTIAVDAVSATAKAGVEKVGGSVTVAA
jgi:large subunit ribosomal protein L15